jgi:signal recognition particle receptor subunit beta
MSMLRELKAITGKNLIKNTPLIVVLNKCDLENRIRISEVKDILKSIGLYYEPDHPLYLRNPKIFETIAIENKEKGIYAAFSEIIQRVITDVNLQKINLKPNGPITSIQGIYA